MKSSLVGKLLNAQKGTVYKPYAGTASYLGIIGDNCTYIGQEFFHLSAYVSKLYILINGKKNATIENRIPDST